MRTCPLPLYDSMFPSKRNQSVHSVINLGFGKVFHDAQAKPAFPAPTSRIRDDVRVDASSQKVGVQGVENRFVAHVQGHDARTSRPMSKPALAKASS